MLCAYFRRFGAIERVKIVRRTEIFEIQYDAAVKSDRDKCNEFITDLRQMQQKPRCNFLCAHSNEFNHIIFFF